jgi:thioredoxin-related protein
MRKFLLLILLLMTYPCLCQNYFDKYNNSNLGTKAADFSFKISGSDTLTNLYNINSPYTLLVFYNPDCEHCIKEIKELRKNDTINRLISQDSLTVISIPPEVDEISWQKNLKNMPKNWKNAYCGACETVTKKYIWLVPEEFWLDKDKRVIKINIKKEEDF